MQQFDVKELGTLGYGNPDAAISTQKKLESGEFTHAMLEKAAEIIKSSECMVAVTENDDGCIDGRLAETVLFLNEHQEYEEHAIDTPEDHQRQKVAGGGYLTGVHILRGMGASTGYIDSDLEIVIETLAEKGVFCGLHTGNHSSDTGTDCGANDKAENIDDTREKFAHTTSETNEEPITASTIALLSEGGIELAKDTIHTTRQSLAVHKSYFAGSNGAKRYDIAQTKLKIVQMARAEDHPISVSKHLGGSHNEAFIVVNYVDGFTFCQAVFARLMQEAFPDIARENLPQAFVVDVPRISKIAHELSDGLADKYKRALYAGVEYQVATAATLTDGSLPIFAVH